MYALLGTGIGRFIPKRNKVGAVRDRYLEEITQKSAQTTKTSNLAHR
jgi:hypothetical protein